MAKWDFKIVGASFVKELVPVNGDVEFRSQSFMQPSFDLEGDKIVMKEGGAYKTTIVFSQMGTIDGIEPTDIEDAYAKLLILVENFNQGGGTPGTTPSLQQVATKGAVTTIPLKVTNVKIGDYDENGKAFSISDNNDAVSNLYYTPLVGFVADDGAGSTAGLTPYEFNVGDVSENSILIKTGLEINQSGVANTSFSIDKLTTDNGEYLYPTGVSSPLATLNDITGGVTPTLQQVLTEGNEYISIDGLKKIRITADGITQYYRENVESGFSGISILAQQSFQTFFNGGYDALIADGKFILTNQSIFSTILNTVTKDGDLAFLTFQDLQSGFSLKLKLPEDFGLVENLTQNIQYKNGTFAYLDDIITLESGQNINIVSNEIEVAIPPIANTSSVFGDTTSQPFAITTDSLNNVYVVTMFTDNVTKITPSGSVSILGTIPGASGAFSIATDSLGNVYTANSSLSNVTKITPLGVSTILGTTGNNPTGIVVDSLGNVYTCNQFSNNVTKITPSGSSSTLGTTGIEPISIAIDSLGNIYTANAGSNNVTKITPSGSSSTLGTTGSDPYGIVVDSLGNVYTPNYSSNNVTKITPSGSSSNFDVGANPIAITIDSLDNVYVGTSVNVVKITPSGVLSILQEVTGSIPFSGITVDSLGNVYTSNVSSNNVLKITIDSRRILAVDDNLNIIRVESSGGGIPTLQEVLDNNHDLVDGNFFVGNSAGIDNTGNNVNALGESSAVINAGNYVNSLGFYASYANTGNNVNALGNSAALGNSGNYVNALGFEAGVNNLGNGNTFNNVNLFGESALADEDGQTVLSKDGTIMARISTTELTDSRKYTLQDADGTLAFLSDITGATPTLQEVTDEGNEIITDDNLNKIVIDKDAQSVIFYSRQDINSSWGIVSQFNFEGFETDQTLTFFESSSRLNYGGLTITDGGNTIDITATTATKNGVEFATLDDIPAAGVPYTGATQDVNLGEFGLLTGNIEFDNTPTNIPTTAGSMVWNDTDGTVDLKLKGGNVTLQIGQENVLRVVNKTATNVNLLEANYQAVRVTGAQGQRLKVDLAQATTDALSAETIGLVTETINNNQEGFITTSGLIRNVNTTGSLQSETWADGDILYLSPTVAGQITKVKPTAPNHLVIVGYVVHAHATQGSIFVKVDNGYELNELHNVKITSETNNQLLAYTSATDIWENKNLIDILKTFNKTQGIYFFEEFMGIQGGSVLTSFGGLVTTTSGTGANCITTNASFPIVNRTNQQGVVRSQTGTTLSGFAGSSYGSVNLFRGNGTVSVETYVTVETLSTLTERFHTIFGHVGVANFNNPGNGIFFAYDEGGAIGFLGAGSPNWRCYAINTTRTIFTSSVAVVAGTWYKLRIDLNAAGTQAAFYINDNLITTLTTNMPATTTPMAVQNVIVKTIGTTTRAMQTDYFMYEEIFTNPR